MGTPSTRVLTPSPSPQQTLYEKWGEFRSLMVQEQRLVRGEWGPGADGRALGHRPAP